MKRYVVEDSSFLVALIDNQDTFHGNALFVYRAIADRKNNLKIIIPALALYEVIVTLHRKGTRHSKIEEAIMRLIHIDYVITTSLSELSAFRHSKKILTNTNQASALRTNDFYITSTAIDYEALIVTFDKPMREKVGQYYDKIYFCSRFCNMTDETNNFISELDSINIS